MQTSTDKDDRVRGSQVDKQAASMEPSNYIETSTPIQAESPQSKATDDEGQTTVQGRHSPAKFTQADPLSTGFEDSPAPLNTFRNLVKVDETDALAGKAGPLQADICLLNTSNEGVSWCLLGEFNVCLCQDETAGTLGMAEFKEFVTDQGVTDLRSIGQRFTWWDNWKDQTYSQET